MRPPDELDRRYVLSPRMKLSDTDQCTHGDTLSLIQIDHSAKDYDAMGQVWVTIVA